MKSTKNKSLGSGPPTIPEQGMPATCSLMVMRLNCKTQSWSGSPKLVLLTRKHQCQLCS